MGAPDPVRRHSALDDAQGLFIGTAVVALGLAILQSTGLVTGQIAGLALLVATWTGLPFGPVFFALNLPFYWLAIRRLGWSFTLKTFACVGGLTLLSIARPHLITFGHVQPLAGAVIAGICMGLGLLGVFRHGASLGGVGVVAFYLQDRFGFRAGWTQLLVDAVVFALALLTLPAASVLWSLCGAVAMNLVIMINHRRDWYVAM
ncbi:YitT family protein [Amaricoccus solimangrovi]|uniref:YitT family protein n=1 Tax=Amaricoccus solimangrovi TaxID=2589815 RepID=A0A501WYI7_9RHOB|nr:YitT family protein [Amaricoccus solimangrovi]TPE53680.1 YitT family protein [Amaricoccus solimangrovi]